MSELCTGRFVPLQEYFSGVILSDLLQMDVDDVLAAVPPQYRLLATVFWREVVLPRFTDSDPTQTVTPIMGPLSRFDEKRKLLSFAGMLVSTRFRGIATTRTSCDQLADLIAFTRPKDPVEVLDLSSNDLLDDDMAYVFQAVKGLTTCHIVILKTNRFHGLTPEGRYALDPALRLLLQLGHVDYVDIISNPLATIDRQDLFETIPIVELEKLIWVPSHWVEKGTWKTLLLRRSDRDDAVRSVEDAHNRYYALMRSLVL